MATHICIFNDVTNLIDKIDGVSVAPGTAGYPVVLNADGIIDATLLGLGVTCVAGETLSIGSLVNIYNVGGTLKAQLAYASTVGTPPNGAYPHAAQGFVADGATSGASVQVELTGEFLYSDTHGEFSTADLGVEVYLSAVDKGGITKTAPVGVGQLVESVGYVVNFASNIVTVAFGAGFKDFSQISGVAGVKQGGTGANLSGTGGAHKFVQQSSTGAALTVDTIATGDLPSLSSIYLPLTGGTLVGNLLFTDNTLDIGASGATRPRTLYLGTSLDVGGTKAVIGSAGTVTKYNNISTVSGGVPAEYATSDLTAQSAAISATTIYAVPAAGAGMYRIAWSATITTADGTSSVLGGANGFQVLYTSPTDSVVKTTISQSDWTSAANVAAAAVGGSAIVYAKASTNIQFSFGYTSNTPGQMVYELHIKVEAL